MGKILGGLFGSPAKSKQQSTSSSTSGNSNLGLINSIFGPAASNIGDYGNMVGNLLGINGVAPTPSPVSTNPAIPGSGGGGSAPYTQDQISAMWHDGIRGNAAAAQRAYDAWGSQGNAGAVSPAVATTLTPSSPVNSQPSALEAFANSGGMNFLREQGMKSINADRSAKGLLQSGSTGTALTKLDNGLASTYLNQFMQNLFEQQRIQLGAGGLLSSAGQYSNSTGQSTGSSNGGKHGLIPDILVALAASGGGGGGGAASGGGGA